MERVEERGTGRKREREGNDIRIKVNYFSLCPTEPLLFLSFLLLHNFSSSCSSTFLSILNPTYIPLSSLSLPPSMSDLLSWDPLRFYHYNHPCDPSLFPILSPPLPSHPSVSSQEPCIWSECSQIELVYTTNTTPTPRIPAEKRLSDTGVVSFLYIKKE